MNRGQRSIVNWLLSGVSVSSAYFGLAFGTLMIGIVAYFALHQVEQGIQIFVRQYQEETFQVFASSVYYLKFIILSSFVCISVFIFLFGKGVRAHILNQGLALEWQLDSLLKGDWSHRRQMRRHDELKGVMKKIHLLAETQLGKKGR